MKFWFSTSLPLSGSHLTHSKFILKIRFKSFIFLSFCVSAQTWKELNDSLNYFYKNGDFEKGIIIGEEAVILAKKEFGESHPRYATSLNNLAGLYSNLSQYEKAASLYSAKFRGIIRCSVK